MRSVVIYYSRTGNTQRVAEVMAQEIQTEALALNLMKKGKRTKEEIEVERALFSQAIDRANEAETVIIGTPTERRKPHPRVMKFIEEIKARKVAIFCTYYGMLGATLIDMEARLRQAGIQLVGTLNVCVGTEQYRFRQDVSQYVERITETHLLEAKEFARHCCFQKAGPVELRLWGFCGKDCSKCLRYQEQQCEGAGIRCWSGSNCQVFECCVIKKSLSGCDKCDIGQSCDIRDNLQGRPANDRIQPTASLARGG